ncbi:MAG: CocE/NonD family hydrolase [bacterium]|nr:CocE/NonD family hydrolase [bacterium]
MRSRFLLLSSLCSLVLAGTAPAAVVQPNVGYLSILEATPGDTLTLVHPERGQVASGQVDVNGSLLFPFLEQGVTYAIESAGGGEPLTGTVLRFADHPPQSFYEAQTLTEGYQYIRMRDGTLLAATVRPPLGKTMADGPFPTVIEYSGYNPAEPGAQPSQPSELITWALGYAVVGVNMRGSGCSGGVFGIFDYATTADGYDVVETVGVQPWVLNNKVGMVGLSFSGITQTFVGGARPPHLGAVAPLSTIGDIYRAPGYPGGIFNNGFAQSWLDERRRDAEPAPAGGQGWARRQIEDGDTVCLDNQKMRLQQIDPVLQTKAMPFYTPSIMEERSPATWVGRIEVPMFYSAAFHDEQTGPDFAAMLSRFPVRPDVKVTVQNGVHTSPFDPEVLWDWIAFLDIYVAGRIPDPSRMSAFASILTQEILGADSPAVPVPPDDYDAVTSLGEAKARFESAPFVTVRMENGAGSDVPGLPVARYRLGYSQWPPKEVKPTTFFFGKNGKLAKKRPRGKKFDIYRPDPAARPMSSLPNGDAWAVIPPYEWLPLVDGTAVAYTTPRLKKSLTVVGPSSVDLWLRSSAADTDIQVTLSEVRPDGQEIYVQSGYLRASHRKLDEARSTSTHPVQTHLESDAAPMPAGEFVPVRVELYAVSHVFRKGSRLRISVEAPGGDRVAWAFDTPPTDGLVVNDVARGGKRSSKIVLSVVPTAKDIPATLPPCPSLRGQPCRPYAPAVNGG